MECNDELKEINIKNLTCYFFDDIIKMQDFEFGNILLDEKPYQNILICNTLYKTLISTKPLHMRFDKVDGIIRVFDRAR